MINKLRRRAREAAVNHFRARTAMAASSRRGMTAGEIRKALDGLPDGTTVRALGTGLRGQIQGLTAVAPRPQPSPARQAAAAEPEQMTGSEDVHRAAARAALA